jgi:phage gpG-like protein
MIRNVQTGKEFSQEMHESNAKLHLLLSVKGPEKAEVVLEKTIHESFQKETYQDGKSSKWDDRKEPADPDRALLVGDRGEDSTGERLQPSITVERRGDEIVAGTNVIYAQVHNEGGRAGRGAGFMMPKRQFMPIPGERNEKIDREMEKYFDDEMDKIFK